MINSVDKLSKSKLFSRVLSRSYVENFQQEKHLRQFVFSSFLSHFHSNFHYRRSRLLFSSLREHISEIFGAMGAHISSLASPVLGTSAKTVEKNQKIPKTSERFRTLPDVSERVRMHPSRSEQVPARLRSYENLEKLAKLCEIFSKLVRVPSSI